MDVLNSLIIFVLVLLRRVFRGLPTALLSFLAAVDDIRSITVEFNSYTTDISFQYDEKFSSNGNLVVDDYFVSKFEGTRGRDLHPNFSVCSPHSSSYRKGLKLVTDRKYIISGFLDL